MEPARTEDAQPRYRVTVEEWCPDFRQNPSGKVHSYQIKTQVATSEKKIIANALRVTADKFDGE